MPRPTPSLASSIAALSHAASAGCPAWVTPDAWQALAVAVALLTRDAHALIARGTMVAAAAELRVGLHTLHRSRRGWLLSGRRELPGVPPQHPHRHSPAARQRSHR